jgi:pimeloyl-ACP methyl ester carboxylesterase
VFRARSCFLRRILHEPAGRRGKGHIEATAESENAACNVSAGRRADVHSHILQEVLAHLDATDEVYFPGWSIWSSQGAKSEMSRAEIDADTFHADVRYIESLWRRLRVGEADVPVIDIGRATGDALMFVPILEQLEFVYARQIRAFSQTRRVIMYRRREAQTRPMAGLGARVDELRQVLDALGLARVDLVGHGDAAMVLLEFATRYPQRCRSLIIVAQGPDYRIAPHPFIWLLHELFLRLPVEYILPARFLRRIVVKYIVARKETHAASGRDGYVRRSLWGSSPSAQRRNAQPPVSRLPRPLIEEQFRKIARWPFVYKFSVLPVIHNFDIRARLGSLTMPILLINRADDALSPEHRTRWLAERLPNCLGYYVIPGGERFFMYAQAQEVNALMERFLRSVQGG